VFTDAVEVVERLPLYWANNIALYVYDETAGAWQAYPLPVVPAERDEVIITGSSENVIYIEWCSPTPFLPLYALQDCRWQFDTTTHEFTPRESVCSVYSNDAMGAWVPAIHPETYESVFCNTVTGELSAPLPFDFGVLSTTGVPFTTFVPFRALNEAGTHMIMLLYGVLETFELRSGARTPIGTLEGTVYSHGGVDWIDETHVLLVTQPAGSGRPARYNIYVADVTQANSATLLYSGEAFGVPNNFYNPRVLEWLEGDCTFYEMPFETLIATRYTIPGVCGMGVPIEDGSGDWLLMQNDSVLRYNRESREAWVLFIGDIECHDFSPAPGGLYQVLRLGAGCEALTVLALQSGEIVYRTTDTASASRTQWLNSDTLLIDEPLLTTDRLVYLPAGEEVVLGKVFGTVPPYSADGHWILLEPQVGSIGVYDATTRETTLIAQGLNAYEVRAIWQSDDTLIMRVETAERVL
jgi:hypothetical protein